MIYSVLRTKLPEPQRAGTYAIIIYFFVRFPPLCIAAKHQAFSQWERAMKTLSSRRRHVSMDTNSQARKLRRNRALLASSFKTIVDQDAVLERQHLRFFYL